MVVLVRAFDCKKKINSLHSEHQLSFVCFATPIYRGGVSKSLVMGSGSIMDSFRVLVPFSLDILFPSNHNIHKSSYGFCFWVSDPLIERF